MAKNKVWPLTILPGSPESCRKTFYHQGIKASAELKAKKAYLAYIDTLGAFGKFGNLHTPQRLGFCRLYKGQKPIFIFTGMAVGELIREDLLAERMFFRHF